MKMSEKQIERVCKAMGIKKRSGLRHKKPGELKAPLIKYFYYPTGTALDEAIEAKLVEFVDAGRVESFEASYSNGEWCVIIHYSNSKAKYGQDVSQEYAATKVEARLNACKQAFCGKDKL